MADLTEELLIEQVLSAHRARSVDGQVKGHPAWYDLGPEGRRQAFAVALLQRQLEAALDPEGLSSTVRAVLARIARP